MKNIFLILLLAVALNSNGQAVPADPALGAPSLRSINTGETVPANTISNQTVIFRLPVRNLDFNNQVPNGSVELKIGLGGNLRLDPTFTLSTARLSQYFTFTSVTTGGQVQITGTQIAAIPAAFFDSTEFRVQGSSVGSSSITASITPINTNVDDLDPNNNTQSLSYTVFSTTVMPSKITVFNVTKTGCTIDVNFVAEEQTNVNRYEVEFSKNGNDFNGLGRVSASANGRYRTNYTITDAIKSASLYVRLKTVDNDGKFEYSAVRRIAGTCDARRNLVINVYPNPITTGRSLTINSNEGNFDGKYNVTLLDVNGRMLQVKEMQLNNVSNFKFDIGTLASGQYMIKVATTDETESSTVRFQKQ
jgi:hypothetical protein